MTLCVILFIVVFVTVHHNSTPSVMDWWAFQYGFQSPT